MNPAAFAWLRTATRLQTQNRGHSNGLVNYKTRIAGAWHEAVLVKRRRHAIVIWLSISTYSLRLTRRKQGPSKIFSGRYVAQSLTRKRRRGHTAARISVKRLRQAMLRIVRLRTSQPLRRRVSPTSGGRRQPQARATKKPIYRMELRSRVNQV